MFCFIYNPLTRKTIPKPTGHWKLGHGPVWACNCSFLIHAKRTGWTHCEHLNSLELHSSLALQNSECYKRPNGKFHGVLCFPLDRGFPGEAWDYLILKTRIEMDELTWEIEGPWSCRMWTYKLPMAVLTRCTAPWIPVSILYHFRDSLSSHKWLRSACGEDNHLFPSLASWPISMLPAKGPSDISKYWALCQIPQAAAQLIPRLWYFKAKK